MSLIALLLPISAFMSSVLIASIALVLAAECFNTAIEKAIDLISPEFHPLAGAAKDLGSAGVFCSICAAAILWCGALGEVFL